MLDKMLDETQNEKTPIPGVLFIPGAGGESRTRTGIPHWILRFVGRLSVVSGLGVKPLFIRVSHLIDIFNNRLRPTKCWIKCWMENALNSRFSFGLGKDAFIKAFCHFFLNPGENVRIYIHGDSYLAMTQALTYNFGVNTLTQ